MESKADDNFDLTWNETIDHLEAITLYRWWWNIDLKMKYPIFHKLVKINQGEWCTKMSIMKRSDYKDVFIVLSHI